MLHLLSLTAGILALGIQETTGAGCSWKCAVFSNGDCFKYVKESKTWQEAQAYCQSLPGGGTLAQITSNSDLFHLQPSKHGFMSGIWIGANDIKTEGVWRWPDQTSANLGTLWAAGQPDNLNDQDCVELLPDGRVNDLECSTARPFVCMEKPVSTDPCWLWPGATHNDGRCFKYISDRKNWADSQAYCQSLPGGGILASVRSDAERLTIAPEKNGLNQKAWSGVNDIDVEGKYVWANKEPASIAFLWAVGEPNNYLDEDCAYFYPNGLINDSKCEDLLASVCMLVLS